MDILPHADDAVIPIRKFTEYALNKDRQPNKATAFDLALGYNIDNVNDLIKNIRCNIHSFPAVYKGHNGFGDTYEVLMELKGPNGKTAMVLTGWVNDNSNGEIRLITAYVDKRRKL